MVFCRIKKKNFQAEIIRASEQHFPEACKLTDCSPCKIYDLIVCYITVEIQLHYICLNRIWREFYYSFFSKKKQRVNCCVEPLTLYVNFNALLRVQFIELARVGPYVSHHTHLNASIYSFILHTCTGQHLPFDVHQKNCC